MFRQWLRNLVVVMVAGLLLAGCSSSGTQTVPTEPSAEPVDTRGTTAPSGPQTAPEGFDASGNPYEPGSNRLLTRTFYFEFDRSVLKPDDLAALETHATILRDNPDRSVIIEGHADERGTREYNLALGERRANSVRSFLTSAGVSPRQVESVSYGEERPEDPGHSEDAYSRNRRAVLVYR